MHDNAHAHAARCVMIRGLFFFQGPIGCEIKTNSENQNLLFATFSYTFQLLLYIVAASA